MSGNVVSASAIAIDEAARLLAGGELVAFPTETVYGLGADATNDEAVRRIFAVKGRPADHPVIVHIANRNDLGKWARAVSKGAAQLAEAFWPGPLTLILPPPSLCLVQSTAGRAKAGQGLPSPSTRRRWPNRFGAAFPQRRGNGFG